MVQPTNNDYELLSAYLDDVLSDSARAALDARLENDPALRQALDDLRATVQILHAVPQVKPPRNFTLDPARYQRHAPWWARGGFLQLAGAIGTLASILLITVGALFGVNNASVPAVYNVAVLATQVPFTATPVLAQSMQQATSTEMNYAAAQAAETVTPAATTTRPPLLSTTPRFTATPFPTMTLAPTTAAKAFVSPLPLPLTPTALVPPSRPAVGAAAPEAGSQSGQSGSGGAANGAVSQPTPAGAAALSGPRAESATSAQANDQAQGLPPQATALSAAPLPVQPTQLTGTPTAPDTVLSPPVPATETLKSGVSEGTASVTESPIPERPTLAPQVAAAVTIPPIPPTSTPFPALSPTASVGPVNVAPYSPPTIPWLLIGGIALLVFSLMLLGIGFLRSRL